MRTDSSSINRQFWKFVIPSILSLALTGIYCFVDAFFVGNMVGDAGLAAINISFAFISIVYSLGVGIGAGSSVKYSVFNAQGDTKTAKEYIGASFILSFLFTALFMIPMLIVPKQILVLFGASAKVAAIGEQYLFISGLGSVFLLFGNSMVPIVRNSGGSIAAMVSVISGCVSNMILDWLFVWVFDWGIAGAAYATVIGQIITVILCLAYLIKTGNITVRCTEFLKKSKDIIRIGISPFGLCMVPNISVIVLNKAALYFGGDYAIAAYGCMAYLVYVAYLIMQGVGEGAQPIISTLHGNNETEDISKVKKKVYYITLLLALLLFLFESLLSGELATFMGSSEECKTIIERGLPILAAGFFFVGLSRSIASCLYAEEHNIQSYIISYSEPVLIFISLLVLPKNLGLDNVWLSNTIAQLAVMVIAIVLCSHKTSFVVPLQKI